MIAPMKKPGFLLLLLGCAFLSACASYRDGHPMAKAADRVIEEITQPQGNAPQNTTLAAKPATEKP